MKKKNHLESVTKKLSLSLSLSISLSDTYRFARGMQRLLHFYLIFKFICVCVLIIVTFLFLINELNKNIFNKFCVPIH